MTLSREQEEGINRIMYSDAHYIMGIDEVGYGPLAGPLTVAAITYSKGWSHADVRDSKKLSAKKRESLELDLTIAAMEVNIVDVSPADIDRLNIFTLLHDVITSMVATAMFKAPIIVVIDGNWKPDVIYPGVEVICFPKADDLVPAVSAASILAKVHRDKIMHDMAIKYPGYGFETNVGYGSKVHMSSLTKLGPTAIHRKSFAPVAIAAALHVNLGHGN